MQATVNLRVLDANTFLRDSLIGSYQFDLLGIYVEKVDTIRKTSFFFPRAPWQNRRPRPLGRLRLRTVSDEPTPAPNFHECFVFQLTRAIFLRDHSAQCVVDSRRRRRRPTISIVISSPSSSISAALSLQRLAKRLARISRRLAPNDTENSSKTY